MKNVLSEVFGKARRRTRTTDRRNAAAGKRRARHHGKQNARFDHRRELRARLDLVDKSRFEFCFITDFPMYGLNEETGVVEFTHNPFSMPQGEMDALMNKDPLDILAYQYDIVCNGVELSSGAVRNHRPDIMLKAFEIAGYLRYV